MLAIPPSLLHCTVYLYPTEESAHNGSSSGGTGFIVAVPSVHAGLTPFLHVVTNKHVIDGGCHFLRFRDRNGESVIMKTEPHDWQVSLDDDLAAVGFGIPKELDGWFALGDDIFLDANCEMAGWPILPGDEVFFVGRFISFDGKERNKPLVRFGNISMLADDENRVSMGSHSQLAFLVESRSQSGFSGSPAFVILSTTRPANDQGMPFPKQRIRFLGVVSGHLPIRSIVRGSHDQSAQEQWVETNSGMAVVIPAWRVLALLNHPSLVESRLEADRRRALSKQNSS